MLRQASLLASFPSVGIQASASTVSSRILSDAISVSTLDLSVEQPTPMMGQTIRVAKSQARDLGSACALRRASSELPVTAPSYFINKLV